MRAIHRWSGTWRAEPGVGKRSPTSTSCADAPRHDAEPPTRASCRDPGANRPVPLPLQLSAAPTDFDTLLDPTHRCQSVSRARGQHALRRALIALAQVRSRAPSRPVPRALHRHARLDRRGHRGHGCTASCATSCRSTLITLAIASLLLRSWWAVPGGDALGSRGGQLRVMGCSASRSTPSPRPSRRWRSAIRRRLRHLLPSSACARSWRTAAVSRTRSGARS